MHGSGIDFGQSNSSSGDLSLGEAERPGEGDLETFEDGQESGAFGAGQGSGAAIGREAGEQNQRLGKSARKEVGKDDRKQFLAFGGRLGAQTLIEIGVGKAREKIELQLERAGMRMTADDATDIEDDGTGQPEMGEEQGTSALNQRSLGIEDTYPNVRQSEPAEGRNPGSLDSERDKSRPGRKDGMAELCRPEIALSCGAASRIGLSARGEDDARSPANLSGSVQDKPLVVTVQIEKRFVEDKGGTAAGQTSKQGIQNIGGLVADRKDFAGLLDLSRDALGLKKGKRVFDAESCQGGVEKTSRRPKSLDDATIIGGMSEIASRPAGHEDFDAGTTIFFEQENLGTGFGSAQGGHQPGGPSTDDSDLPGGMHLGSPCRRQMGSV